MVNKQLQYGYCPISRGVNGNQTNQKLGQLIKYNRRNIPLQKHAKNEAGRQIYFIALYELKGCGLQLSFNVFQWSGT